VQTAHGGVKKFGSKVKKGAKNSVESATNEIVPVRRKKYEKKTNERGSQHVPNTVLQKKTPNETRGTSRPGTAKKRTHHQKGGGKF